MAFLRINQVTSDVTVHYDLFPMDLRPVVVQSGLYESGHLFIPEQESGRVTTLYDARGKPCLGVTETEVVNILHWHPCFADAVMTAVDASARGELGTIRDLIARVAICRDKYAYHLDQHDCRYTLKSRPAGSFDSSKAPLSLREINLKGILENHLREHESIDSFLKDIFQKTSERLCFAPTSVATCDIGSSFSSAAPSRLGEMDMRSCAPINQYFTPSGYASSM